MGAWLVEVAVWINARVLGETTKRGSGEGKEAKAERIIEIEEQRGSDQLWALLFESGGRGVAGR